MCPAKAEHDFGRRPSPRQFVFFLCSANQLSFAYELREWLESDNFGGLNLPIGPRLRLGRGCPRNSGGRCFVRLDLRDTSGTGGNWFLTTYRSLGGLAVIGPVQI